MISNEKLKNNLSEQLINMYPVESTKRVLKLKKVHFTDRDVDPNDYNQLDDAIKHDKSISNNVYGDFELRDKETGKTISTKKVKMGELPVYSDALKSFVVNGSSYAPRIQSRLLPGAYGRIKQNKDIEVFSNVDHGANIRTFIHPASGKININIHQANVPLYPILKSMGVPDSQIKRQWGVELFDKNKKYDIDKNVKKLHAILHQEPKDTTQDRIDDITTYFEKTKLTPKVNKKTLGTGYDKVSAPYLLDTSRKVIGIMRGEESPDNRDSLINKKFFSTENLLADHFRKAGLRNTHTYKSRFKMDDTDDISKIVDSRGIKKDIEGFFTNSQISQFAEQTNPISMITDAQRTTLLGEGGISSTDSITREAKMVQNTHAGFLDPHHTPESHSAGVTLTLAQNTKVEDDTLKIKVLDTITNKSKWMSWEDIKDQPLAFPKEFKKVNGKWRPSNKKVNVIQSDERNYVPGASVRYVIEKPSDMFDTASNLVPFLQSDQGNRMMTSAKMGEQTVALTNPEKPWVEPVIEGKSVRDTVGEEFSIQSKGDGEVTSITKKNIIVTGPSGEKYKHPIFHNLYLNGTGFLDADIRIKKGDKVKKGTVMADSNFTKDGKYVDGVNMTVAYIPWKGLTYEDATVITESAAKKLTSAHLYKKSIPKLENTIFDLNHFNTFSPDSIKSENYNKYDKNGIIRIGQKVKPHEIMAASLSKNTPMGSDNLIRRLKKSAVAPFKDNSLEWNKHVEGDVVDVVENRDAFDIYVKTQEPVKKADKIVGSHGNKGVVSMIIPDKLAPRTRDGKRIDWIQNPHGVPSRINWGQYLETAAGKLAKGTNKVYEVENFSGKNYRDDILNNLKRNHISEKEDIFDPSTGKTLKNVFIGQQYTKKLKQQVDKKYSSRGLSGSYTRDNAPTAGGGSGGQSIDNLTSNVLLAHNARENLKEMFSLKNNPNADYWRAVQHGQIPPSPEIPFEYEKFKSYITGMGVNPESKGSSITLNPLTDKDIDNLSEGPISNPTKSYLGKGTTLQPIKDGLFGEITGGFQGEKYTNIDLPEILPSPAYEDAIKTVLHMTQQEYEDNL